MDDLFSTWILSARALTDGGIVIALSSVCLVYYFARMAGNRRTLQQSSQKTPTAPQVKVDASPAPNSGNVSTVETVPAVREYRPDPVTPLPSDLVWQGGTSQSPSTKERELTGNAGGMTLRNLFEQELEREVQIAYATSSELSLILLDLDRLADINAQYGQKSGDDVLRNVARVVNESLSHLRGGDLAYCGRYGGDEFAVILPGVGPLGTARIAELIRGHVEKVKIQSGDQALSVTVSLGVTTYPENGATVAELMTAAETALIQAKQQGRNRIGYPQSVSFPNIAVEPAAPAGFLSSLPDAELAENTI